MVNVVEGAIKIMSYVLKLFIRYKNIKGQIKVREETKDRFTGLTKDVKDIRDYEFVSSVKTVDKIK